MAFRSGIRTLIAMAVCASFLPLDGAHARSKAAQWLIDEQIRMACDGRGGSISPVGLAEQDLTGDGKADLIIDHAGIECVPGANTIGSRSGFCGIRACSVLIYVRDGALLQQSVEILSIGFTITSGSPPGIALVGHGFEESTIRWNGRAFQ